MAMKLVAVVAEHENQRVLIIAIPLERRDDLPHLLVGLEQAIVVVGNFFPHLGDIGIIGWNRDDRAIDHRLDALAQLAAAELYLSEKGLTGLFSSPAIPLHQGCGAPTAPAAFKIVEGRFRPGEVVIVLIPFIEGPVTGFAETDRERDDIFRQDILIKFPHVLAAKAVPAASMLMGTNTGLHHPGHNGRARS